MYSNVNVVFNYAINRNVSCVKASIVDTRHINFAPVEDKWDGVCSPEDRRKILEICEKQKPNVYIKAIELMFCLDIRIGELRALQKNDVDFQAGKIRIEHQMVDVTTDTAKRHPIRSDFMKGKKDAGKREHPLSERAIRVIEWLFEHYPDTIPIKLEISQFTRIGSMRN